MNKTCFERSAALDRWSQLLKRSWAQARDNGVEARRLSADITQFFDTDQARSPRPPFESLPAAAIERGAATIHATTLCDAAGQIMSTHGDEATTIAALSQAIGLNVSSICRHFGSKARLLAAPMERGAQGFLSSLEAVLRAAPKRRTPQARLRWVMA